VATVGLAMIALTTQGAVAAGDRPATNGALVFQREVVAGDHTQDDVWTVSPDGSGPVRLTQTPQFNEFGPTWSRAGDQIAFWRTPAPFGTGSLWVMAGDGSAKRRLTTDIDARDPSWNPAGSRLVYNQASDDLYTLRASDGLDRQQLTSGPPTDFEPAWSPGGGRIAFTRGSPTGDPGNIAVLDLASHTITRLTHSAAYDHQVAWGPGGHRLVFERDFGDRSAIFSIRSDGTDLQRVTGGAHFDVGPTYSPDASMIAFGSDRGDILDDLWTVDSDGSGLHLVLGWAGTSEAFPDWQGLP